MLAGTDPRTGTRDFGRVTPLPHDDGLSAGRPIPRVIVTVVIPLADAGTVTLHVVVNHICASDLASRSSR
jgi:hypothetical protein